MNSILVSIIIPCYNVQDYVAECLDSAIHQTYRPIEIIAVDNNSTDGTLAILKDYEKSHPELVTVLEEKKQGPSAARNKGMTIAKGEWLQFLDADDLLLEDKIAHQMKLIDKNPFATLIVGAYLLKKVTNDYIEYLPSKDKIPIKEIVVPNLGCTVSNIFKKTNYHSRVLWDENLTGGEDANFMFDYLISFKCKVVYDDSLLTIIRERPFGQTSKTNSLSFIKSCLTFQVRVIEHLKKNNPTFYKVNETYFVDNLYYFVYRAGLFNPEYGELYYKELFTNNYFPSFKRENKITKIHSYGFKILGFRPYVRFRKFIKDKLSY